MSAMIGDGDADFASYLESYEASLNKLEQAMAEQSQNKYSLLHNLRTTGCVFTHQCEEMLKKIKGREGESDFALTPLIRCLYLDKEGEMATMRASYRPNLPSSEAEPEAVPAREEDEDNREGEKDEIKSREGSIATVGEAEEREEKEGKATPNSPPIDGVELKTKIIDAARDFPFWPTDNLGKKMEKIVFWSENHLFMTLGSAYLYFQYRVFFNTNEEEFKENALSSLERQQEPLVREMLLKYLKAHIDKDQGFQGFYEVNSQVYLPFTLSALFNLFDFALDKKIKELSEKLIDRIVEQIMLCTDPQFGIANLSASARYFLRMRQRNFGHSINSLVKLMNAGNNIDDYSPSYLTGFLTSTQWRPKLAAFRALHGQGEVARNLRFSHQLDIIKNFYCDIKESNNDNNENSKEVDEAIPFYWSAGLVVHPLFAGETQRYQQRYKLERNVHLWPLSFFFFNEGMLRAVMGNMSHLSEGQSYLDIRLNVFKQPGLMLSSFETYNAHKCGFQQSPWMACVGGVPVWSRAGLGSESVAGFGVANTHGPSVQQRGYVLVASYATPSALRGVSLTGSVLSARVHLLWPKALFEGEDFAVVGCTFYESKERIEQELEFINEEKKKKPVKLMLSAASWAVGMSASASSASRDRSRDRSRLLKSLRLPCWLLGERQGCYIACHVTDKCRISDETETTDFFQETPKGPKIPIEKIYSDSDRVSIVVVVGSKSDFNTLEEFVNRRLQSVKVKTGASSVRVNFPSEENGEETIQYVYPE